MVNTSMPHDAYQKFSRYYEELTYDMPYPLWLDIIHSYKDGRHSVLDIGCGTGALTRALDFDEIQAFDLSAGMIEAANSYPEKSIDYFTDDMRTFQLNNQFDIITATVDVLNYAADEQELMQIFEQVKKHLSHTGVFIFDIHSVFKMEQDFNDMTYSDETEHITYIWDCVKGDAPHSVIHDMSFFIKEDDSGLYTRFDEIHHQRTYNHKDMLRMIDNSGMSLDIAFSDFDMSNPVSEICERVFYVIKKAL